MIREALRIRKASPHSTAYIKTNLGKCLVAMDRFDEAEELFLDVYRTLEERPDASGRIARIAIVPLVALYEATGRPDDAAEWRAKLSELD